MATWARCEGLTLLFPCVGEIRSLADNLLSSVPIYKCWTWPSALAGCTACAYVTHTQCILAPCLQVQKAVEDGYDVRGFMYWTLVDK